MVEETILIVTSDTDNTETTIEGERGWGEVRQHLNKAAEIPVSVLEENMNRFLQVTGRLFQQVDTQLGTQSDLRLDEVQLQVEISAKGEVKLFAGGEASGKGVITLKLKRPNH
ncbi:Pepco domain-containing protein [Nostoc sp.]